MTINYPEELEKKIDRVEDTISEAVNKSATTVLVDCPVGAGVTKAIKNIAKTFDGDFISAGADEVLDDEVEFDYSNRFVVLDETDRLVDEEYNRIKQEAEFVIRVKRGNRIHAEIRE